MTDEERAYSRGQSDAYADVFRAFAKAFEDDQDIHWLHQRISAQLHDVLAAQVVRAAL